MFIVLFLQSMLFSVSLLNRSNFIDQFFLFSKNGAVSDKKDHNNCQQHYIQNVCKSNAQAEEKTEYGMENEGSGHQIFDKGDCCIFAKKEIGHE